MVSPLVAMGLNHRYYRPNPHTGMKVGGAGSVESYIGLYPTWSNRGSPSYHLSDKHKYTHVYVAQRAHMHTCMGMGTLHA